MPPIEPEGLYQQKALGLGRRATDFPWNARSLQAGSQIGFGLAVIRKSGTEIIGLLPVATDAGSGVFIGVAAYSTDVGLSTNVAAGGIDSQSYASGDPLGVAEMGEWMVQTESATKPGDAVHYRFVAGTGAQVPGNFTKTADTGKTFQITAGAQWLDTAAGSGVARLRLNPPFTTSAD